MAEAGRRRALVTGASAGLGEEFARQLAARDHDLVLVARRETRLASLAAELTDAAGVTVEVLPADLTDDGQVGAVESRLRNVDSPIDLLVNNAGFGTLGRFDTLPIERELQEIRLNVVAVVRLAHAATQAMLARGRGGVINVSSIGAHQPVPTMATYGATKSYVSSFSHALHQELGPLGVRVMVLEPGFTHTEFQARAGVEAEQARVPWFLWGAPDDIVASALADFDRGRAVSVPGWINKVMTAGASALPAGATRRIAALLMGS